MSDEPELLFSADFVSRVLGEADRVAAQKRRLRWSAGFAVALASAAGIAWLVVPAVPTASPADSDPPRLAQLQLPGPDAPTNGQGALGYLFPDAAPLASFDAQYSQTDDPGADTNLFGGEDAGTP